MSPSQLSTYDVAKICQVSPLTVAKWVDTGKLKGFKLPGSRFRRIREDDLRAFMEKHGMPVDMIDAFDAEKQADEPEAQGMNIKVLAIDDSEENVSIYREIFENKSNFEFKTADGTSLEIGYRLASYQPQLLIVNMDGKIDGENLCDFLKHSVKGKVKTKILAINGNDNGKSDEWYRECGADDVLDQPFKVDDVWEKIEKLVL